MRTLLMALLVTAVAVFTPVAAQHASPASATQTSMPSPGTQVQASSEPAAVIRATTRMVVLDVVATDRNGNPVTDLNASDFRVLEGGREQRIRTFTFEQPIPAATKAYAVPTALKLPENTFSNIAFAESPRTLNVILLDLLNTAIPNQLYAKSKMLQFLRTMPANQPTHSGESVNVALVAAEGLHQSETKAKSCRSSVIQNRMGVGDCLRVGVAVNDNAGPSTTPRDAAPVGMTISLVVRTKCTDPSLRSG